MDISITMENIKQYYMHVNSHKMDTIVKQCKCPRVNKWDLTFIIY